MASGHGNWKMSMRERAWGSAMISRHRRQGEFEKDEFDPMASPTTPLHFGKRNLARRAEPSKRSKISDTRSHHIEGLQTQLTEYMKATGMDQNKVIQVLEKLKQGYMAQSEQQEVRVPVPSSPKIPTSLRLEDPPLEASTIALLQQKFAQLEKYKESIQNQQVQLYPYHATSWPSHHQEPSPAVFSPKSPCAAVAANGFYYPFEQLNPNASPNVAQAQKYNYVRPSVSGTASPSSSPRRTSDPMGSPSWSSDSSGSNIVRDEAADALLQYMLQPTKLHTYHQKVGGVQGMELTGSITASLGCELMCGHSGEVATQLPEFSFQPQQPVNGWGSGLSLDLQSASASPASSTGEWESEASEEWRNMPEYQSFISHEEREEELDTSLHL